MPVSNSICTVVKPVAPTVTGFAWREGPITEASAGTIVYVPGRTITENRPALSDVKVAMVLAPCITEKSPATGAEQDTSTLQTGAIGPRMIVPARPVVTGAIWLDEHAPSAAAVNAHPAARISRLITSTS